MSRLFQNQFERFHQMRMMKEEEEEEGETSFEYSSLLSTDNLNNSFLSLLSLGERKCILSLSLCRRSLLSFWLFALFISNNDDRIEY